MNSISNRTPSGYPQVPTIKEETFDGWSSQGAIQSSKNTHERIRSIISRLSFAQGANPEIFLQGSYRNDTNIRGNSDVDIVILLTKSIDLLTLYPQQINASAIQQWISNRDMIVAGLRYVLGSNAVTPDKKCIRVAASTSTLKADIVVAFRRFNTMNFGPGLFANSMTFDDGLEFYVSSENRWVTNYPQEHYSNGTKKNSLFQTNGWYKPTVRVFKNYCSKIGLQVPSYFLECLIYNVPNSLFGTSYQRTFNSALTWLRTADLDQFLCQNGRLALFGDTGRQRLLGWTPEQWEIQKAEEAIFQMIRMRSQL